MFKFIFGGWKSSSLNLLGMKSLPLYKVRTKDIIIPLLKGSEGGIFQNARLLTQKSIVKIVMGLKVGFDIPSPTKLISVHDLKIGKYAFNILVKPLEFINLAKQYFFVRNFVNKTKGKLYRVVKSAEQL